MRISDWSSDVCSSDLVAVFVQPAEIADGYEAVGGSTGRLATPIFEPDAVPGKGTKENLADLAGRQKSLHIFAPDTAVAITATPDSSRPPEQLIGPDRRGAAAYLRTIPDDEDRFPPQTDPDD